MVSGFVGQEPLTVAMLQEKVVQRSWVGHWEGQWRPLSPVSQGSSWQLISNDSQHRKLFREF